MRPRGEGQRSGTLSDFAKVLVLRKYAPVADIIGVFGRVTQLEAVGRMYRIARELWKRIPSGSRENPRWHGCISCSAGPPSFLKSLAEVC